MDNVAQMFLKTHGGQDFMSLPTNRFTILECIGDTHLGETYLLSEKETGEFYVLKTQRDLDAVISNEAELLDGLRHEGLPVFEKVLEQDGVRYIIRKYIEGETLGEHIEKSPTPDTAQVISVMLKLCDILGFLHSQPKPIIHRDIKPSNIIISPCGNGEYKVVLIDFGISRKYSENAETDTVQIVTQKFAPPEQYGFAQTDQRSDIYSLGVVLRYWLTGTTDKSLAKIAAKCTALAPEARYQSAAAVKNALLKYKNRTKRRVTAMLAAALMTCIILIAVIAINTNPTPPQPFFEISQEEFREFAENVTYRTDFLRRSATPTLTYIEGGGIKISNRIRNYYSVDFFVYTFPPGQYILKVDFYSDDESTIFALSLTEGPPWGNIVSSGEHTIEYNLTIKDIGGENRAIAVNQIGEQSYLRRIRLRTSNIGEYVPYPDFVIRSIRLYAKE